MQRLTAIRSLLAARTPQGRLRVGRARSFGRGEQVVVEILLVFEVTPPVGSCAVVVGPVEDTDAALKSVRMWFLRERGRWQGHGRGQQAAEAYH